MTKFAGDDNPLIKIEGVTKTRYQHVVTKEYDNDGHVTHREVSIVPVRKKMQWTRANIAKRSYPEYSDAITRVVEKHEGFIPKTYIVDGTVIHVIDVDPKSSGYGYYKERYKNYLKDPLFKPEPIVLDL